MSPTMIICNGMWRYDNNNFIRQIWVLNYKVVDGIRGNENNPSEKWFQTRN